MTSRLEQAFERFDRANSGDPRVESVGGRSKPRELVYAERMTDRLERFAKNAPEALRLAARCQHLCRWTIPRTDFPVGRAGYRRWRTTLAEFHARAAAEILLEVGYDATTIAAIEGLLKKERLKTDPDVQILEDVACLVFLEHYLEKFSAEHSEAKLVEILRKTWRKMSDRGRDTALTIDLAPELKALVIQATEELGDRTPNS